MHGCQGQHGVGMARVAANVAALARRSPQRIPHTPGVGIVSPLPGQGQRLLTPLLSLVSIA